MKNFTINVTLCDMHITLNSSAYVEDFNESKTVSENIREFALALHSASLDSTMTAYREIQYAIAKKLLDEDYTLFYDKSQSFYTIYVNFDIYED